MRKRCLYIFLLIAEDIIDTAIAINNLQSEAGSDQLSHISNWMSECTISSRNSREIQGVPMDSSCLTLCLPGVCLPPAGPAGLAGHPPCWSGEVGEGSQVWLPPPPCPAALNAGKQHCWFCWDGFVSVLQEQTLRAVYSRVLQHRRLSKMMLCPMQWNMIFLHGTLCCAWLQLGLQGMLHPVVLSQLVDQESQHHGPFSPAPWRLSETSCWLSVCALLSCWVTDQRGWTSPLSCSSSHDFTWGQGSLPLQPRHAKVVMHFLPAKLICQAPGLPGHNSRPGWADPALHLIILILSKKSKQLSSQQNAGLLHGAL